MRVSTHPFMELAGRLAVGCLLLSAPLGRAQEAPPRLDPVLLAGAEEQAKAWLEFLLQVQRHGALPTTVVCDAGTGRPQPFDRIANDDSAAALGKPFLWAYRVWRDDRYLRGATSLADFFVRAQFPEGGWAYQFTLQSDGSVKPAWRIANFEEWVQSNGLRHIAAVYTLTRDARYRDAASKAGEVILKAQNAAGWWPWGAPAGADDGRADYMKGPTLNDWNLNACMGDCLVLHHITGDRRYAVAVLEAGDWIISAQLPDPTPGWAAQYDMQGRPAWARYMEPPAADTNFGTYGAGAALLMLYDITGQDRYLAPLRKHLAWLESIPAGKKGWMWYAHRAWSAAKNKGTPNDYTKGLTAKFGASLPSGQALAGIAIRAGEPIVAYHYQMVPVDHPELQCYLKPLNSHYGSRSPGAQSWLAKELAARESGPIIPGWNGPVSAEKWEGLRPTAKACRDACGLASLRDVMARFADWQAGKAVKGFVDVVDGGRRINVGRGCAGAAKLLRHIAYAHVALGKASPDIVPVYRPLSFFGDLALVDPTRDWYDIEPPDDIWPPDGERIVGPLADGMPGIGLDYSRTWAPPPQRSKDDRVALAAGTVKGTIEGKGRAWLQIRADGGPSARYIPEWFGGMPAAGGGPEQAVVQVIRGLNVGDRVIVKWYLTDHIRIYDLMAE